MIRKHLTDKEQLILLEYFHENSKQEDVLLELLFYTGLRTQELLSLTRGDIDLINSQIHLRTPAKGSNPRTINVPARLVLRLDIYTRDFAPNVHIYAIMPCDAKLPRSFARHLQLYWEKLRFRLFGQGFDLGLHAFRHTFCSRVLRVTENNLVAAKIALGHKAISSTLRYAEHETMQDINQELKKFNRTIQRRLK